MGSAGTGVGGSFVGSGVLVGVGAIVGCGARVGGAVGGADGKGILNT